MKPFDYNKYIPFSSGVDGEALLESQAPVVSVKKFSKSFLIAVGFLGITTVLSLMIAYGKQSNLGVGTFTSINRINDWSAPDNFTVLLLS